MNTRITEEIAEAVKQHGRPLLLEDSAGALYYVLTGEQFRQYVYDDSELTEDEMIAAGSFMLDDPES